MPSAEVSSQSQTSSEKDPSSVHEWLKPETWPLPSWHEAKSKGKLPTYEAYVAHQLRTRYVEQENDFRTVFGNFQRSGVIDYPAAERIVALLHTVRKSLEQENPALLSNSSALDLIERYMVWLYPPQVARPKALSVLARLESLELQGSTNLAKQISSLLEEKDEQALWKDRYTFGGLRGLLDQAIGTINEKILEEQIGRGLQLRRLRSLRLAGLVMLAIFLAASPLIVNPEAADWASSYFPLDSAVLAAWLSALGITIVGAVGGFLSGLLQVRSSRVTLSQYQESVLKLQLKPIVGGLVALIAYIFLSWQILPGIKIESAGSYVLIAFLSGFSERYFLRLLELKADGEGTSEQVEEEQPEMKDTVVVTPNRARDGLNSPTSS